MTMKYPESGSVGADVLGIHMPENPEHAFAQAFQTLNGRPFSIVADSELFARDFDSLDTTEQARRQDMEYVGLLMRGMVVGANTMTNWPSYAQLIQKYGERANGSASALMVGALTPLSARSFAHLAQQEYGAQPYVVDLAASDLTARHASFVRGNGLALPFKSESMDFFQTDQLLHMLHNPSDPDQPFDVMLLRLLSEAKRVLAEGGQLYMVEPCPGSSEDKTYGSEEDVAELGNFIQGALGYLGMSEVHVGRALYLDDIAGYLFDGTRNPGAYGVHTDPVTLAVYARK